MATDKDKALALKNEGNQAFLKHNWTVAIEKYSNAIELDGSQPTYYANRAQAYLKTEAFGYAIADATKAIELDPKFVKAYYRRALAAAAIIRPKDALVDFKICVRLDPGNRDAKIKLADCQKIVRQLNFFAAIEVGDEPSAAEGLDVESMAVEPDYDGLKLGDQMTQDFIDDMTERFKTGKKIHRKYVYQILLAVTKLVHDEPTMVEIEVPEDTQLTVCGDTHGQYFDLMELFRLNGKPSDKHWYLFNGDFVDRGSWSTEIALLLYANKWLRPQAFFLNRGNHETDDMNRAYGFEGECKAKYNERVFRLFSESFSALPLATLIGSKYLVLHGGLFSNDNVTLDDIRKLDRHKQRQPGQAGLMMEMLWTDPQTEPGRGPSKRGVGMQFGPDVTARFCDKNGLEAIIRSHEVRMDGYEKEHNGKCITVFSAPKYCDMTENRGAYINLGSDYKLEFHQFDAVPHPNIRPMAYANNSMMSSLV
ncbi:serine/threonine-protein phosphatase ppt1 [Grosmannia clavigera kw1407]|uniref:Serine/threonine-protein phosphatase n=1 Tax=Grosmannia clavigera (strain kw1407 / UAMH 11150) TaxID=655863 RepID=F0XLT5_GROCL|nr:serine/threonine-protein phosphatase ppt1 [Grosmannia clavigera kw1407]EFX01253.1 serine/threonine-protein phosphatase ppt1 [Grosmannia clavigera kw1407]